MSHKNDELGVTRTPAAASQALSQSHNLGMAPTGTLMYLINSMTTAGPLYLLTVLIDRSVSMDTPEKVNSIIQVQNEILEQLRHRWDAPGNFVDEEGNVLSGARCGDGEDRWWTQLWVQQWFFNDKVKLINGFVQLNSPALIRLNRSLYAPSGPSTLYDTIIATLSVQRVSINYIGKALEGVDVRLMLVILSDGEDTKSVADVIETRDAIKDERIARGSVIYIGIGSQSDHKLIGQRLGVDISLSADADDLGVDLWRAFGCN